MVVALFCIGILCLVVSFGLEDQSKIVYSVIGIIIMAIAGFMLTQAIINNQPGGNSQQHQQAAQDIEAQPAPTHFGGVSLEKFKHDD